MDQSLLPQLPDNVRGDAERRRHADNKGRLAMVGERFETTGQGVFEFEAKVDFGLVFIRKPFLSYGAEIDPDQIRDLLNLAESVSLPAIQCTGYVYEWDTTPKGMYTGAWVAASVLYPPDSVAVTTPPDALITIGHHFSWYEIALKSIGVEGDKAPEFSA